MRSLTFCSLQKIDGNMFLVLCLDLDLNDSQSDTETVKNKIGQGKYISYLIPPLKPIA